MFCEDMLLKFFNTSYSYIKASLQPILDLIPEVSPQTALPTVESCGGLLTGKSGIRSSRLILFRHSNR